MNWNSKSWQNLNDHYRLWKDLQAKGRMRMKKKNDKDGKQYYDFDFSRYHYYYSYPDDHISLAAPTMQKQFIQKALQQYTEDYSSLYTDQNVQWENLQRIMRPYEYHTALQQMKKQFHQRITTLRIQKSLRIAQSKDLFSENSILQKSAIDLIDAQIRSYCYKLIKVSDIYDRFGKNNQKRIQNLQTNLKARKIDDLQIASIGKSQIIVYMRSRQVKQTLNFNLRCLNKMIENVYANTKTQLEWNARKLHCSQIKKKKDRIQKWKQQARQKIYQQVQKIDPNHFQNIDNKEKVQELVSSLDFITSYQQNIKRAASISYILPQLATLGSLDYHQFRYRPIYHSEIKQRLFEKCLHYFPQQVLNQNIFKNSDEHICYKINNLCFLQSKTLWETYDPTLKYQDGGVLKIRQLMKMELHLVFSHTIDSMLNIREHSIKIITPSKWDPNLLYNYVPKFQKQSIMMHQLNNQKFRDPLIYSILNLLDVKKDTIVRQSITKYVTRVLKQTKNVYWHTKLFYDNCCQDQKKHLVNVLHKCISIKKTELDSRIQIYLQALYKCDQSEILYDNILYSYYSLTFLRCTQMKYEILQILNAQRACMLKLQDRLGFLWKKSKIPFNMTKQFMDRFTEDSATGKNPFDFLSSQKSEHYLDNFFRQLSKDCYQNDTIVRKNGMVQVQRKKSANALVQGKSIIYEQSFSDLQQLIQRIGFLCSRTIKFREEFLYAGQITYLLDRYELIYDYLLSQKKFQQSKLLVLEKYTEIYLQTTSPEAIKNIYNEMHDIKNYNHIVDLSQSNYLKYYQEQSKIMNYKYLILDNLAKKQRLFETATISQNYNNFKEANLTTKKPQISSMYYTEQIKGDKIIQQEQQSLSQSVISDGDYSVNKNITIGSDLSSMMDGLSQYQLKVSFRQILMKNSMKQIQSQNQKKQQLMSKKGQKIINDSILGAVLPKKLEKFQNKQILQFSYSVHQVISIMHKIDSFIKQNCNNLPYCSILLRTIIQEIQNYVFVKYKPLVHPQQLSLTLNCANRIIQKFMQKSKNQSMHSGRSNSEHLLCLSSKIIKNIVNNQSGQQLDEMRGLYICLNFLQLNQIDYLYQIDRLTNYKSSKSILINHLQKYSNANIQSIPIFQEIHHKYLNKNLSNIQIIQSLKQSNQLSVLSIGNYMNYFKAISALNISLQCLLKYYVGYLQQQTASYKNLLNQLQILQNYQCYSQQLFDDLCKLKSISNKVYLRKKIQFLNSYSRSIIRKQSIQQFNQCVNKILLPIRSASFVNIDKSHSVSAICSQSQNFEQLIKKIGKCSIQMFCLAQQIKNYVSNLRNTDKINETIRNFPYIQKSLFIQCFPKSLEMKVFSEDCKIFENKKQQRQLSSKSILIKVQKLKIKETCKSIEQKKDQIYEWLTQFLFQRQKNQIKYDPAQANFTAYENRHCLKIVKPSSLTLQKIAQTNLKQTQKMFFTRKLLIWMQNQIIIFGCSLQKQQLIKFRMLNLNKFCSFPIFWQNNTHNFISPKDLDKMKGDTFQSNQLIQSYKGTYLQYQTLQKQYSQFLQDLSQFDYKSQLSDSLLILYFGCKQYFQGLEHDWQFLMNYAHTQHKAAPNKVDSMLKFMYQKNPAKIHKKSKILWRNAEVKQQIHYDFDRIKYYVWGTQNRQRLIKIDEMRRFIKYRLNEYRSFSSTKLNQQVVYLYYRKERLQQLFSYLNINPSNYPLESQQFINNFDKKISEGQAILNQYERPIYYMNQKSQQFKRDFIKVKDEAMNIIVSNQFSLKILREHFYTLSTQILEKQLRLTKILMDDFQNQQFNGDQLTMKQTINKILLPKVKMNPFLSSPLIVENYFFAGSAKLSFIDQFLNKLRNRAILIELAEGGFGYLLKVNELNESVQTLCKAIVGFSQKEFSDRLRTVYESFSELSEQKQKYKNERHKLKTIVDEYKISQRNEVKSVIYQKLTEYLVRFHEQQKCYNILINLLKSLQNKYEKKISQKYEKTVKELKNTIRDEKNKFVSLSSTYKSQTTSQIRQLKDQLYDQFKDKAENVLQKKFIQQLEPQNRFTVIQHHDSTILLKKLKQQKVFYEMRINRIQSMYENRVQNLQTKLLQQNKLQNLLNVQQQKVKHLLQQIKQLQKCSVQNQMLKKQISKKDEEQTLNKFRLVKVNQSLRGKLQRIDEDHQKESSMLMQKLQQFKQTQYKSKSSFSVQVDDQNGPRNFKRKSFYFKTQGSVNERSKQKKNDYNIWKQKWLKNCSLNQNMIEKLKKITQHLQFTKNIPRACQSLKEVIKMYQTQR